MEWRKGEPVGVEHVRSSLIVALKLAKFRRTRGIADSDEVCGQAADAVMESFKRSGFEVVHANDKLMKKASELPPMYKRCEGCED